MNFETTGGSSENESSGNKQKAISQLHRPKDITCGLCGNLMTQVSPNRKYCDTCRKKLAVKASQSYRAGLRSAKKAGNIKSPKLNGLPAEETKQLKRHARLFIYNLDRTLAPIFLGETGKLEDALKACQDVIARKAGYKDAIEAMREIEKNL